MRVAEKLKIVLKVEIFDAVLDNESHHLDLDNDGIEYNFELSDIEKKINLKESMGETEIITKAIRRLTLAGGESEIGLTQDELNIFEAKCQIKLPQDLVSFFK